MRRQPPQPDPVPSPGFKLLAIKWVRRNTPVLLTVGLISLPLSLALLDRDGGAIAPKTWTPRSGEPPPTRASPATVELSTSALAEREKVTRLSRGSTSELVGLLTGGDTSERLIAANVLWARGQSAEVEAVARESQDRVLKAKVEALRRRQQG